VSFPTSFLNSIGTVPAGLLVLATTCFLGKMAGSVKWAGVKLGGAGVLFAGLAMGHFGFGVEPSILSFSREIGLILFVYAIGVSVGPGFFSSLRSTGLKLNLLAAGIVLTGVVTTLLVGRLAGFPMPVSVGLFSGATTNIPSLSAASRTLEEHPAPRAAALQAIAQADPKLAQELSNASDSAIARESSKVPGLASSAAYPFGVLGVILAMLALRGFLRQRGLSEEDDSVVTDSVLITRNFELTNPALHGHTLRELSILEELDLVVSRIRIGDTTEVARKDTRLETGCILLAVGTPKALEQFQMMVGKESEIDLRQGDDALESRWLILTEKSLVGKTVPQLRLIHTAGVRPTRVRRGELQLLPTTELRLNFGDAIRLVGTPDGFERAAKMLGNQPKHLDHPDISMLFLGLILGVLVGMIPFAFPGIPVPVKLGLGGGPMIVALLLGRIHRVGSLVAHLPVSASILLKDFGISLFLAAVGLQGGSRFVSTFQSGQGLSWMLWAALITLVPLLVWVGVARRAFGLRFPTISGVMAGSTTNPPALDFAQTLGTSQETAVAYATVYPLAMILRIVAAQVMVLLAIG